MIELNFTEIPNSSPQDILFIHGNLASSVWWEPTLNEWNRLDPLTGQGSLLLTDWRGCGKNPSWPVDQPFSLVDLAEDHLRLLKKINKRDVALVGHSLGGLIALQMMILEPGLVARALLLDPVGCKGVVFDDSMYQAFRQMADSPALTRTVVLSTVLNRENLRNELCDRIADDAAKAVQGIGFAVLNILKTVNLEAASRLVSRPVVILHGQHDQIIPLADSQHLARTLPNCILEILPDAGHCWNMENPGAFVKRLRDWLLNST